MNAATRCHTFTGIGFDPLNPRAEDVRLGDIAHHLSMIVRFGGAAPVAYSVAEHAIRVARLVEDVSGDPVYALHALHHDSAEAYVGDQRRPLKDRIWLEGEPTPVAFEALEGRILVAIAAGLQIPVLKDPEDAQLCSRMIREADDAVLAAEFRAFFPQSPEADEIWARTMIRDYPIDPASILTAADARAKFMSEHGRLACLARLMAGNTATTLRPAK